MARRSPIITLEASASSSARPTDVYDVLADPSTHVDWAGEQSRKDFRLVKLDAPKGHASVGTTFTSVGANSKSGGMTFYDESVVTAASSPSGFGFETSAVLERKHRPTWRARFVHTYAIAPDGTGSRIDYSCDVFPSNYRPWWLHPLLQHATKRRIGGFMTKNLQNLAGAAKVRTTRKAVSR